MNIELRMERLILDGIDVPAGQRHLLQAAVEAELSRLLTERGVAPGLTQGALVAELAAEPIALAGGGDPLRLGQQIAQSVFGSIAP
ncbi:hypothetical protein [Janthinobacterium fluminis]|uniref:Uncharacterized protein n=1 Tax=Janthinobacterium fluminis TaxID=2987524 RepID=A0ABT5JWA4_9BURK|nr:hypothetical protein [Janthinobacterium fluminis]MDC8757012.1 hypothetical protein [Janthinobacterium fluminis]